MKFKDTSEIKVPDTLIDQIIGQDRAVKIIRNAAKQRRNILLIGTPGTGKSMLAQGMAELMPAEELEDVLMYPNRIDENNPLVRAVKTKVPPEIMKKMAKDKLPRDKAGNAPAKGDVGQGRVIIEQEKMRMRGDVRSGISPSMLLFGIMIIVLIALSYSGATEGEQKWIIAAAVLGLFIFGASYLLSSQISRRGTGTDGSEPKLIVDNSGKKNAPFVDATGSKAGALFGDVKHDPLQSFAPEGKFYLVHGKKLVPMSFAALWKRMSAKYPEKVEQSKDYEYLLFPKTEEVYVLSASGGEAIPTRVMSMNRRQYSGRVLKVSSESGEIVTTPEHRFILPRGEKEADALSEGEELLSV